MHVNTTALVKSIDCVQHTISCYFFCQFAAYIPLPVTPTSPCLLPCPCLVSAASLPMSPIACLVVWTAVCTPLCKGSICIIVLFSPQQVVVGGGPTGVECAAELHDMVQEDLARLMPQTAVRWPVGTTIDKAMYTLCVFAVCVLCVFCVRCISLSKGLNSLLVSEYSNRTRSVPSTG